MYQFVQLMYELMQLMYEFPTLLWLAQPDKIDTWMRAMAFAGMVCITHLVLLFYVCMQKSIIG